MQVIRKAWISIEGAVMAEVEVRILAVAQEVLEDDLDVVVVAMAVVFS